MKDAYLCGEYRLTHRRFDAAARVLSGKTVVMSCN
jgi:hypothetical protein